MATSYAKVNPEILCWARKRAQLSLPMLADKLHVSEGKVSSWEAGEALPTFKQAQNFAAKTRIPFGYLYLPEPPFEELPIPDLRTVGQREDIQSSAALMEVIQIVMRRQQWYEEYQRNQGNTPNPQVGKFTIHDSIDNIVRSMRVTLNVADHPTRGTSDEYFRLLVNRIEDAGILVMGQGFLGHHTRPLSVEDFRGFAISDPIAPVIFINQADSPSARLFTLIHELAHVWMGESGVSDASPQTQREEEIHCNAIAAEFLVPASEFESEWLNLDDWRDNLPTLEAHFHVSQWVITRRALTLNKISLQEYQEHINDIQKQYRNREKGQGQPPYYRIIKNQLSARFSKAIVSEALSGRMLLRDASQLLNVKPNKIATFAKELGI